VRVGVEKEKKRGQTTASWFNYDGPLENTLEILFSPNWTLTGNARARARSKEDRGKALPRGFHIFRERLNNGTITILGDEQNGGYSRWTDSILNRLSTNVPSISN